MSELRYCRMSSPVGGLTLVESDKGLCGIAVGRARERALLKRLGATFGLKPRHDPHAAATARAELREYFAGRLTKFVTPLDIRTGTAFQRKVWRTLRRIPWGETWSYRRLATATGRHKAFRAVGCANGANPIPIIIPCHRVVRADGSLGGFGVGVHVKQALLRLESALPLGGFRS